MGYNGVSGPGRSSVNYSGGSYGGAGESSSGMTYGSTVAPVDPGSGGRGTSVTDPGGAGGGVVRIEASGAVTLYGTISARGSPPPAVVGCGSGGSIYITCKTLAGGGVVSVNGGSSANTYCGGGGGGRIAVIYTNAVDQTSLPGLTFAAGYGLGGAGWLPVTGTAALGFSTRIGMPRTVVRPSARNTVTRLCPTVTRSIPRVFPSHILTVPAWLSGVRSSIAKQIRFFIVL